MEYNFKKDIQLFMIFDILGDTERMGPLLWKINRNRTEDVKNHVFDLIIMLRILKKYLPKNLDFNLMEEYIIVHDLPEAITGDITKFEGVSDEEISRVTNIAISYLIKLFDGILPLTKLFREYENKNTIESKIVHMLDKVQSAIPFMKYQIEGKIDINNPLINKNLINHPFVIKMIKNGKDLADIFYEFHIRAVNITDQECLEYGINRESADEIVNIIKSYANSLYEQKKDNTLLDSFNDFPKEATIYNKRINN